MGLSGGVFYEEGHRAALDSYGFCMDMFNQRREPWGERLKDNTRQLIVKTRGGRVGMPVKCG